MIHVHAFRAITDIWTIHVAVVGNGEAAGAWAEHVVWNDSVLCDDVGQALDRGVALGRAFIDEIASGTD